MYNEDFTRSTHICIGTTSECLGSYSREVRPALYNYTITPNYKGVQHDRSYSIATMAYFSLFLWRIGITSCVFVYTPLPESIYNTTCATLFKKNQGSNLLSNAPTHIVYTYVIICIPRKLQEED